MDEMSHEWSEREGKKARWIGGSFVQRGASAQERRKMGNKRLRGLFPWQVIHPAPWSGGKRRGETGELKSEDERGNGGR